MAPAIPSVFSPLTSAFSALGPMPNANSSSSGIPATPHPTIPNLALPTSQPQTAGNTSPSSYTAVAGDTLSSIAGAHNVSLQSILNMNPQFKPNPNMLREGQIVNLPVGAVPPQSGQKQGFQAPVAPQAPGNPIVPGPGGSKINAGTGETLPPAGNQTTPAATTPVVPSLNPYESDWYKQALENYQNSQTVSQEEIDKQNAINNIQSGLGITQAQEQARPIPMDFITGRLKSEQNMALALEKPIQQELALLQARRTGAAAVSKASLEAADARAKAVIELGKPVSVSAGSQLINPYTGEKVASVPARPISVSAGSELIDPNTGEVIARGSSGGVGPSLFANLPQVNMNPDSKVDKGAQSDFLQKLGGTNSELATLVRGIANYTINPSSIPTRQFRGMGGLTQPEVLALVSQYDPSYDSKLYSTRQSLIKNFTSGSYSQNINALNTATGHLATLADTFSKLGNINFGPYNAIKNAVGSVFGNPSQAGIGVNLSAVTGELANVFKKSGATDQEIAHLGTLTNNSTPNDLKAYINVATDLMQSRLQALQDTYTAGMGKAPDMSFLYGHSADALNRLQKSGFDVSTLSSFTGGNQGGGNPSSIGAFNAPPQSFVLPDGTSVYRQSDGTYR